jgi:hypothetical protein
MPGLLPQLSTAPGAPRRIRPARTIIQDRRMTPRDAVRVPGRTPRSGTHSGRAVRTVRGIAVIGVIHEPRGEDVAGLIYYLYGPGRHEEHTDPHLVTGWHHPAELEQPLRPDGTRDFRKLTGLLKQPHAAMGTYGVRRPVWHLSMRAARRDKVLSDEEWAQIARDVMNRTGLCPDGEEDDGVRCIAVRHGEDHPRRGDAGRRRRRQRAGVLRAPQPRRVLVRPRYSAKNPARSPGTRSPCPATPPKTAARCCQPGRPGRHSIPATTPATAPGLPRTHSAPARARALPRRPPEVPGPLAATAAAITPKENHGPIRPLPRSVQRGGQLFSQRATQLASLIAAAAQVRMRLKAAGVARQTGQDRQARRQLEEQERAARAQAQARWAPAHDARWLAQADLLQAARIWGPAVPWDRSHRRSGGRSAAWRGPGLAEAPSRTSQQIKQTALFAQRPEARADLFGKELRLFPGGEVAAPVEPVVVDEVVGIGALGPAARGLVELVGEDTDGKRDRDGLGVEEALPGTVRGGGVADPAGAEHDAGRSSLMSGSSLTPSHRAIGDSGTSMPAAHAMPGP